MRLSAQPGKPLGFATTSTTRANVRRRKQQQRAKQKARRKRTGPSASSPTQRR